MKEDVIISLRAAGNAALALSNSLNQLWEGDFDSRMADIIRHLDEARREYGKRNNAN
jgi:hypothetical protein